MATSIRPGGDAAGIRVTAAALGLVVMAAIALLSWLVGAGDLALAIAVAVLLGLVVDAVLAGAAVRSTVVELHPPDVMEGGRPSEWHVAVAGTQRPVTLQVLLLGPSLEVVSVDARPGVLPVPPLRRGPLPYAVVDVFGRGPLGLVASGRRHVLVFDRVPVVVPALVGHRERWPMPRAVGFGLQEGAPIGDDLFRAIRPYQRGDDRRHVDWKSSARHGELMVREHDGLGVVAIRIVVDLGPVGPEAERAAGWAAWTATEALRRGWEVELITLDGGDRTAALVDVGRPLGRPPILEPPHLVPLETVVAPVRSPREVGVRLGRAAHGTPQAAGANGRIATCVVDPGGVRWS